MIADVSEKAREYARFMNAEEDSKARGIDKKIFEIFIIECPNCKSETEQLFHGVFVSEYNRKNHPQYFSEEDMRKEVYVCRKCESSFNYDPQKVSIRKK